MRTQPHHMHSKILNFNFHSKPSNHDNQLSIRQHPRTTRVQHQTFYLHNHVSTLYNRLHYLLQTTHQISTSCIFSIILLSATSLFSLQRLLTTATLSPLSYLAPPPYPPSPRCVPGANPMLHFLSILVNCQ